MNRFFRSALFPLFVIVLLVYLASQTLIPHGKSAAKLTYSDFRADIPAGKVDSAEFNPSKRQISGKLTDGKKYSVHYPADQSVPGIETALDSNHVDTLNNMGSIAFSRRQYRQALNFYERALGLDESNALAREQIVKVRNLMRGAG